MKFDSVRLNKNSKNNAFLFDRVEGLGRNDSTMIIGESDLQNVLGHSQCETEQVPKV